MIIEKIIGLPIYFNNLTLLPLFWLLLKIKTASQMTKTVAQKMGVKEGSRAIFINAPKEAVETINLPHLDIASKLDGEFDYMHLFVSFKVYASHKR